MYAIKIILYANTGRFVDNNRLGVEALRMFGYDFPDMADAAAVRAAFLDEYILYQQQMQGRDIASLAGLSVADNPETVMALRLLMNMFSSAYVSNPAFLAFLGLRSVNICVRCGITPEAVYSFSVWGLLLGARFGKYAEGFACGRLALDFSERFHAAATASNVPFVFGNFLNHWQKPLAGNIVYLEQALKEGINTGDLIYASFAATSLPRVLLTCAREPLEYVLAELNAHVFLGASQQASLERQKLIRQVILNLLGRIEPESLSDENFSEERHIAEMQSIHYGTGVALYYFYKMQTLCVHGLYAQAREYADEALANTGFIVNSAQEPECVFWHAMTLLHAGAHDGDSQLLNKDVERLENWAEVCPENYMAYLLLLQAGMAARDGDTARAMDCHERALDAALRHGFVGLAAQCAGSKILSVPNHRGYRVQCKRTGSCTGAWVPAARSPSSSSVLTVNGFETAGARRGCRCSYLVDFAGWSGMQGSLAKRVEGWSSVCGSTSEDAEPSGGCSFWKRVTVRNWLPGFRQKKGQGLMDTGRVMPPIRERWCILFTACMKKS